jgi:hypothetical protein
MAQYTLYSPDNLKLGKVKRASETKQPKTNRASLNANTYDKKKIIFQKCNTSIKKRRI